MTRKKEPAPSAKPAKATAARSRSKKPEAIEQQTTDEHRPAPGQARKVVAARHEDPDRLARILELAAKHRANPGHLSIDSGDYRCLVDVLSAREEQLDDEQKRIFAAHTKAAAALERHERRKCTVKASDLFWLATLAEALDRSQEEPSGKIADAVTKDDALITDDDEDE